MGLELLILVERVQRVEIEPRPGEAKQGLHQHLVDVRAAGQGQAPDQLAGA
jgi:hypothetical protein